MYVLTKYLNALKKFPIQIYLNGTCVVQPMLSCASFLVYLVAVLPFDRSEESRGAEARS
jgi:hypothetical protein